MKQCSNIRKNNKINIHIQLVINVEEGKISYIIMVIVSMAIGNVEDVMIDEIRLNRETV